MSTCVSSADRLALKKTSCVSSPSQRGLSRLAPCFGLLDGLTTEQAWHAQLQRQPPHLQNIKSYWAQTLEKGLTPRRHKVYDTRLSGKQTFSHDRSHARSLLFSGFLIFWRLRRSGGHGSKGVRLGLPWGPPILMMVHLEVTTKLLLHLLTVRHRQPRPAERKISWH